MDIKVRDKRFSKIQERCNKMQERAREFAQSRSSFQIEKFIGCDEYTDVTKFRHLSHNSYVLLKSVKSLLIDREKLLRQVTRLNILKDEQEAKLEINNPEYKDYDLDIYELNCELEDLEINIKGALAEIEVFERACDKLEEDNGKSFTYEQFEEDQPEYWRRRHAAQMHRSQAGNLFGVGEGNYDSYLKALEEPIVSGSKNKINPLPVGTPDKSFNALAVEALKDRKNINKILIGPEKKEIT